MTKHTDSIRRTLGITASFAPLGMLDVSKSLDSIDAERTELLAALEETTKRLENMLRGKVSQMPHAIVQARAAIAKAKKD